MADLSRDSTVASAGAAHALRRTCVHEYAHLAVARRLGACGFVTIVGRHSADEAGGMRYAGRFQMHGELADADWRAVALAGVVAECLDADAAVTAAAIADDIAAGRVALEGADAELAAAYDERDLAACLALVRAAWHEIVGDAAAFVEANAPLANSSEGVASDP